MNNRVRGFIFWNTIGGPFRWIKRLIIKAILLSIIGSGVCASVETLDPVVSKKAAAIYTKVQETVSGITKNAEKISAVSEVFAENEDE